MTRTILRTKLLFLPIMLLLATCGLPIAAPTVVLTAVPPTPTAEPLSPSGLTADQEATLETLEKVDNYPLYTMRYTGAYDQLPPPPEGAA